MLSGFILTHVYGARVREFWHGKAYGGFLKARLIRLYPLHFVHADGGTGVRMAHAGRRRWAAMSRSMTCPIMPFWTGRVLSLSLLLVQAWNLSTFCPGTAWPGSSASNSALSFVSALLWLADGRLWRAVALIRGGGGGDGVRWRHPSTGLDITFHNGIFRGMSDFAIGVGMAKLYRAAMTRKGKPLPTAFHSLVQLAVVFALFYASYHTGWAHTRLDYWSRAAHYGADLALAFDRGILAWPHAASRLADIGRLVLCHLYGPDLLASGHPHHRAAALSAAGHDGARHALFRPDLVAGAHAWCWSVSVGARCWRCWSNIRRPMPCEAIWTSAARAAHLTLNATRFTLRAISSKEYVHGHSLRRQGRHCHRRGRRTWGAVMRWNWPSAAPKSWSTIWAGRWTARAATPPPPKPWWPRSRRRAARPSPMAPRSMTMRAWRIWSSRPWTHSGASTF